MKIILFSYYYENNIIIFILLEVYAFERERFTIRGLHKKGVHVNPQATGLEING